MDFILQRITSPNDISELINKSKDLENNCDVNPAAILEHTKCFDSTQTEPLAYCPQGLLRLVLECVSLKPALIDDSVRDSFSEYLKRKGVKLAGLLDRVVLEHISEKSTSHTMTWLKFEGLLKRLIKDYIYPPKVMADEVLRTVKHELDPALGANLASTLGACVKTCREVNQTHAADQEEEEKWCEIIDWMSWFLSNKEDDNLDSF